MKRKMGEVSPKELWLYSEAWPALLQGQGPVDGDVPLQGKGSVDRQQSSDILHTRSIGFCHILFSM